MLVKPSNRLMEFEATIAVYRMKLLSHPIYEKIQDLSAVRGFMAQHVFAVWDFMSLLKSLQQKLTCVQLPWMPARDSALARFINEIVLAEESDEIKGEYLSHFELYLRAMMEVNADTTPINAFLERVKQTNDVMSLIDSLAAEGGVFSFMAATFELAKRTPHEVAAAFLFGREDIIPQMFTEILQKLDLFDSVACRYFRHYLIRHIQVDGEDHGPLARRMLVTLCADSLRNWQQASQAAISAIKARLALWDHISLNI